MVFFYIYMNSYGLVNILSFLFTLSFVISAVKLARINSSIRIDVDSRCYFLIPFYVNDNG